MRVEAGKRTGAPLDGSSWLDDFSIMKVGGDSELVLASFL